jgi:hypothetical protein
VFREIYLHMKINISEIRLTHLPVEYLRELKLFQLLGWSAWRSGTKIRTFRRPSICIIRAVMCDLVYTPVYSQINGLLYDMASIHL